MDRLERLINLMAALLEAERPLDRLELRRRVGGYGEDVEEGTFRRMFERDKEALRQMGVPLTIQPIDSERPELGDGYRIVKERYELPDPGLDGEELAALRLAVSAVAIGDGGARSEAAARAALWKLGGGEQVPAPVVASLPGSEHLAVLFGAVADRRTVVFPYQGGTRRVDPWRLSCRSGRWYLSGFDHERGDRRTFRVDRFGGPPEVLDAAAPFPRPADAGGPMPPPWLLGDDVPAVEAELLVDAEQAPWAEAEAAPFGRVERRGDGSVVLRFPVTNPAGFRSFVLGFLDHAEVLGPAELRRDVVGWLESLAG